jgi:hypothetical protein
MANYLEMTLDAKLRWKAHIRKKQGELHIKFRKMYWLLGRRSELSTYNKLLIYKQVLWPVWTYGVHLWGYQRKVLSCLANAPWYARNSDMYRDLGVKTVASIIVRHAISHENRLQHHVNEDSSRLLNVQHLIRRLKWTKPFELVKQFDNWGIQWENLAPHHVNILVLKQVVSLHELVFVTFCIHLVALFK